MAGTLASSGAATIHATTLNNLGRIHTEGQASVDARRVNNVGIVEATGGLNINQAWTVQNTGTLSGADVAINTQALSNAGRLQADQLTLSAYQDSSIPSADRLTQTAVVNGGVMVADRMAITGYGGVTNTNQISTDITTTGQATDSGNLRIQAGTFDNTGGSLLAKNKLTIDAANVYNNRATLSSKGDMDLTASGNLDNAAGLILHQGSGSAQVQAGLALNNAKGQIEGQGQSLRVSAGDIDNSQGQIVQIKASTGPQPASLNVSAQPVPNTTTQGQLVNIKGNISSTGNTTITANSVVTDTSSAQLSSASSLSFLDKSKISSGASTATGGYNWNTDIAASNAVTQAQNAADQANAQAQAAATALQTSQTNLASVQANAASTPAAIAQADAFAAVPGIDCLLIGTNDLCAEMGIPGQFADPRVEDAYRKVIAGAGTGIAYAAMPESYRTRRPLVLVGMNVVYAAVAYPAGKLADLKRRVTEVAVVFKRAPHLPFAKTAVQELGNNAFVFRIQPDEGVTMRFGSKVPGTQMEVRDVTMDFGYGSSFTEASPEAYERLLLDDVRRRSLSRQRQTAPISGTADHPGPVLYGRQRTAQRDRIPDDRP